MVKVTDFRLICNTLQIALYHSCSELVNPDGSLTPLGQDTVKCTLSGLAIGGITSTGPTYTDCYWWS